MNQNNIFCKGFLPPTSNVPTIFNVLLLLNSIFTADFTTTVAAEAEVEGVDGSTYLSKTNAWHERVSSRWTKWQRSGLQTGAPM